MNIALSGGTGFIGSHFLKQAIAAGHSVRALRRCSSSKPRIPIDGQPQWLNCQLDEVTSCDLQGCDVLVHLAAHTGNVPYDTLANCLRWNVMAVLSLFEEARRANVRRFVVAGSCFEYGRSGELYTEIPVDASLQPTNSYAASKAAASLVLLQWAEEHDINLEILRVFHVYGEGENETRFWPLLCRAAKAGEDFPMTAGDQIRDFMEVQDVAKTFLERAELSCQGSSGTRVFNLTSGNPISIRAFAEYWWKELDAKGKLLIGHIPYRSREVMQYVGGHDLLKISKYIGP